MILIQYQSQSSLEQLANNIHNEYRDCKDTILKVFRQCVFQLPFKLEFYAVLTGLLNQEIASEFVKIAADLLNEGLETCAFRKVKLMVYHDLIRFVTLHC